MLPPATMHPMIHGMPDFMTWGPNTVARTAMVMPIMP
jgi:hypothetical protein